MANSINEVNDSVPSVVVDKGFPLSSIPKLSMVYVPVKFPPLLVDLVDGVIDSQSFDGELVFKSRSVFIRAAVIRMLREDFHIEFSCN